jgi:transcriptional regulator GlxA family with amidase domain
VACILGLTDMFGVASAVTLDQWRFELSQLRVTHWRPRHSRDANLTCVYDSAPRGTPKPRTLIIPPTMVNLPNPDVAAGVVSWVRNRHAAGSTLVSLCSGAFILAETGLVDGRSVATHQICAESLAKRFPQIVVDVNRRIIDYGDIVTAGGFLSWVDVGLFLVERILGRATRVKTARFVLSDAAGEARYFTGFAPPQIHGDKAVLKAQEWVHMRDGRGVSLAAMATAAGLEPRTLLRRFASATGMTPIEYCRTVRIARARELLEGGEFSQKEITASLGYKDVATFSRVFRKATGLAPGAYRKRFRFNVYSATQLVADRLRPSVGQTA